MKRHQWLLSDRRIFPRYVELVCITVVMLVCFWMPANADMTGDTSQGTPMITYVVDEPGATAPIPTVIVEGGETRIGTVSGTTYGRNFLGWSKTPHAGSVEFEPGHTYSFDKSVTLYAVFGDAIELGDITAGSVWEGYPPGGPWENYYGVSNCVWYRLSSSQTAWFSLDMEAIVTGSAGAAVGTAGGIAGLYTRDSAGGYNQYCRWNNPTVAELQAGVEYYLGIYLFTGNMGTRLTIEPVESMVTYVVNEPGATAPSPTVIVQGEETRVGTVSGTTYGRNFLGWSKTPYAGSVEFEPGHTYSFDESVTLYAVFGDVIDLGDITAGSVWEGYPPGDPWENYHGVSNCVWYRLSSSQTAWFSLDTEAIITGSASVAIGTAGGIAGLYTRDNAGGYNQYCRWSSPTVAELQAGVDYYLGIYLFTGNMGTRLTIEPVENMVTYAANEPGATAPDPTVIVQGEETRVGTVSGTTYGRNFLGWSRTPNAGVVEYEPGHTYSFDESVTLYAVFGDAIDLGDITAGSVWEGYPPGGPWENYHGVSNCVWYSFSSSQTAWFSLDMEAIVTGSAGVAIGTAGGIAGLYTRDNTGGYNQYCRWNNPMVVELQAGVEYYLGIYLFTGNMGTRLTIQNLNNTEQKQEIHLPENLKTIESDAFSGSGAEYVIIPAETDIVQTGAFADCDSLKQVTFKGKNTEIEEGAFDPDNNDLVISAPSPSMAQDYALANGIKFIEFQ